MIQRFYNEPGVGNAEEAGDFAAGLVKASYSMEAKIAVNLLPIRFDIPLLSRWRFLGGKSGFNGTYYIKAVRWSIKPNGATLGVNLGNRPDTPVGM